MPIEIEVCERLMDYWLDRADTRHPKYHAQIKGAPGLFGVGKSADEAVGDLVRSHPEKFGIVIIELEPSAR